MTTAAPPSGEPAHVVTRGFSVDPTAPAANPSASSSVIGDDWSNISGADSSSIDGDDVISFASVGSLFITKSGGLGTGSEGSHPMTQHNLALQTHNTTLTDENKALKAENDTLKAILQIRTLERSLGEQGTVLRLANQVQQLMEELSTKETTLRMFAPDKGRYDSSPTQPACVNTIEHASRPEEESRSDQRKRLARMVRDAEKHLIALRLYAAAEAAYPEAGIDSLVARVMDNQQRFRLPDVASVNWLVLPPLLQAITDHHAGWHVNSFVANVNSNILGEAVHAACATYGNTAASPEAFFANGNIHLHLTECRDVMSNPTVQAHLDFALQAARAVVGRMYPSLSAPWQADTLHTLVKEADLQSPIWADLPFYVSAQDVRALLLRPGFIVEAIRSSTVMAEASSEATSEPKGTAPPLALTPGMEKAADRTTPPTYISVPSSMDANGPAPYDTTLDPPNSPGSAEATSEGKDEDKREVMESEVASLLPLPKCQTPNPLSKNQIKKAKKREEVERRKANKAFMRAEKEKAAAAVEKDAQSLTHDRKDSGARTATARRKGVEFRQSLYYATSDEIEDAREAYANTNVNANLILEALMTRHKILAGDMLAELQLQQRGFYRFTRDEMDVLTHYPEAITIDGETYAMPMPLGERDNISGPLAQRLGIPGTSLGATQGSSNAAAGPSGTSGVSADWEEGSDASTEIGIEYVEDEGEDDFDSDELEDD